MAIKNYTYNSKVRLSKNFNSNEFQCKGKGHTHLTKIDIDLVDKIQEFMNINGYTKAIISSGYRCPEHNKTVGGSSSSTHTQGRAVDISFYKNNKVVSAKTICCKALDYNFKGIAYIDSSHVHLDNRLTSVYRGDETKGFSNNVPNGDFYKYFNVSRETYNLTRTLQKGCKGNDVKELQKRLIELGYNVGQYGTDGSFGSSTASAVKKFQKAKGLKADSIVGKDTAHKLGFLYKGK